MSSPAFVIISPTRNEEKYLPRTIESLAAQTILPARWIIVDDGSTDQTGALADEAAKKYPWIVVRHRADRGFRKPGGGVIEAFYDGYESVGPEPWDYLVKLDADLSFAPTYLADCHAHFVKDTKLGIGGGLICSVASGGTEAEAKGDPPFHVRGATKIYRRACWEGIGGLLKAPGWDTLDEVKANMLGWTTYSFPELKLTHYRFAGDADGSWKNWVKNGRANYITGYHPAFMLMKCLSRLGEKPRGLVAGALWWGFMTGYFQRVPQVEDRALIRYLREQQWRRLTFRPSLWSKSASQ